MQIRLEPSRTATAKVATITSRNSKFRGFTEAAAYWRPIGGSSLIVRMAALSVNLSTASCNDLVEKKAALWLSLSLKCSPRKPTHIVKLVIQSNSFPLFSIHSLPNRWRIHNLTASKALKSNWNSPKCANVTLLDSRDAWSLSANEIACQNKGNQFG